MAKECKNCVHKSDFKSAECDVCTVSYYDGVQIGLPSNFRRKPQTNADRIRAMSDEELAELFHKIVDRHESCAVICGNLDNCKRNNAPIPVCEKHYLEWLKQPTDNGGEESA